MQLPRGSGRPALIVSVDPNPAQACSLAGFFPGAVIRIFDPAPTASDRTSANLQALYGLTPAEARLARVMMSSGGTLRDCAAECGISYATARTQLAGIFAKTQTSSQSALMKTLVAAIAD